MPGEERREAFVTLATNDTYSLGCLVLGSSLRRAGTTRQLVVMITDGVSNAMRTQLAQVFDILQEVNLLDSNDPVNLGLLGRPDLNVTFTKLHCWRLTQFDKAVFLDADTLVLQNVDELFDREELSAAPDAGWPDCFNSGVFVFKPSEETYQALLNFATSHGSFDGGDQGLLNLYFKDWSTEDIARHLPFIYNVVSQAFYSYLPAFTQFKDRVKIVHFIGAVKPWHHTYDSTTRTVTPLPGSGHSQEFLQVWWTIFMTTVQPKLDPSLHPPRSFALPTFSAFWSTHPGHPPVTAAYEATELRWPTEYVTVSQTNTVETYRVLFPYIPPDIEIVYSEDSVNNSSKNSDTELNLVEMSVMPRQYTGLETHYPEAPLSQVDPHAPPINMYDAPNIVQGWEAGRRSANESEQCKETQGGNSGPKHETQGGSSAAKHETHDNKQHGTSENTRESRASGSSDKDSKSKTKSECVERPPSPKAVANDQSASKPVGLVGELASLTIQGATGPSQEVTDAERRLNWEKGQIDYLGQDSFENIMKKIDETLSSDSAGPPAPTTSPFAPSPPRESTPPSAPTPEPTPAPPSPVEATPTVQIPAPVATVVLEPATPEATLSSPVETVVLATATPEPAKEPSPPPVTAQTFVVLEPEAPKIVEADIQAKAQTPVLEAAPPPAEPVTQKPVLVVKPDPTPAPKPEPTSAPKPEPTPAPKPAIKVQPAAAPKPVGKLGMVKPVVEPVTAPKPVGKLPTAIKTPTGEAKPLPGAVPKPLSKPAVAPPSQAKPSVPGAVKLKSAAAPSVQPKPGADAKPKTPVTTPYMGMQLKPTGSTQPKPAGAPATQPKPAASGTGTTSAPSAAPTGRPVGRLGGAPGSTGAKTFTPSTFKK